MSTLLRNRPYFVTPTLSVAPDHDSVALPFPGTAFSVVGAVGGRTSACVMTTLFEAAERLPHGWPRPAVICATGFAPAPRGDAVSNALTVYVCGPAGMFVSVNVESRGPFVPISTPSRKMS